MAFAWYYPSIGRIEGKGEVRGEVIAEAIRSADSDEREGPYETPYVGELRKACAADVLDEDDIEDLLQNPLENGICDEISLLAAVIDLARTRYRELVNDDPRVEFGIKQRFPARGSAKEILAWAEQSLEFDPAEFVADGEPVGRYLVKR